MKPLGALVAIAAAELMPRGLAKLVNIDLNLIWQKGPRDHNLQEMILMNGQFPGPELRIQQGDDVEVSL